MATLTSNSLDNCSSIPCFLPGGTRMIFNNSTSPTSWTKDVTSHDNKSLRLVTGSLNPGPATGIGFTVAFPLTEKQVQGSIDSVNSVVTFQQETISPVTTASIDAFPTISINARTLGVAQLPSHDHSYQRAQIDVNQPGTGNPGPRSYIRGNVETVDFFQTSSGASHNHGFPATAQHNHTVQVAAHGHTISSQGPHSHTFTTVAQDFSVSYVDVIVAQKDVDPIVCSI